MDLREQYEHIREGRDIRQNLISIKEELKAQEGRRELQKLYQEEPRILLEQLELTRTYYDETFTLTYMRKLASYNMKKRKGTKKYKQQLYQCGSLEELRGLLLAVFSHKQTEE